MGRCVPVHGGHLRASSRLSEYSGTTGIAADREKARVHPPPPASTPQPCLGARPSPSPGRREQWDRGGVFRCPGSGTLSRVRHAEAWTGCGPSTARDSAGRRHLRFEPSASSGPYGEFRARSRRGSNIPSWTSRRFATSSAWHERPTIHRPASGPTPNHRRRCGSSGPRLSACSRNRACRSRPWRGGVWVIPNAPRPRCARRSRGFSRDGPGFSSTS